MECKVLFPANTNSLLFDLMPSQLSTHHLHQLSLQQNIKALYEMAAGRPVDFKVYKEILRKDPFAEDLALGASRLAAHGLLNLTQLKENVELTAAVEQSFQNSKLQGKKAVNSGSDNVVYLNTQQKQTTSTSAVTTSQSSGGTAQVVPFGVSFHQVLDAAMSTNLYNSGPIKVHLIQRFQQMSISQETMSELKPLSSGQLLSFKAAFELTGSEVIALRSAQRAEKNMDTASFVFLSERAREQRMHNQPFLELFYKRISIKSPKHEDIVQVSEMIHNKQISLKDLIQFLSLQSSTNNRTQRPLLSLLQAAQIVELANRNHISEEVVHNVFNYQNFLGPNISLIKKRFFQRKTKQGFHAYDLRDNSLLSQTLYSLLTPELVIFLALNPQAFKRFTETFQRELIKKIPSKVGLYAKRLISKPQSQTWELNLYNSLVIEAFSKAENSL